MTAAKPVLTAEQGAVLRLVAGGRTICQAAVELGISESTAARRCRDAARTLGTNHITHTVAEALRQGLLEEGNPVSNLDTPTADNEAIHTWFSLSYSNYLVLHRSLLQSMPGEWQQEFVRLLNQLHAAFRHVDQAECYEVTAGDEGIVSELGEAERKRLGITTSLDDLSDDKYEEWLNSSDAEIFYYDKNGDQLEPYQRVHLPGAEPIPHYNRGRTRIEPDLEAYQAARREAL